MNIFLNFFIESANASSSAHGASHNETIPTVVYYQAINVSIFVGILYWFGKDKVREVFRARLTEFHRLALETEQARKKLEHKKADLQRRTQQLQTTSAQSLVEAKSEAEKMYLSEIEKSKGLAEKVSKDVEVQIIVDQQKMIETLRQETLEMSVVSAEQKLKGLDSGEKQKVAQNAQKRIEGASR
jgi:F-type H+-transporting ATPase subunit b